MTKTTDIAFAAAIIGALGLMFCAGLAIGPEPGGGEAPAPARPALPALPAPSDYEADHRAALEAARRSLSPGEAAEIGKLVSALAIPAGGADGASAKSFEAFGAKAVPFLSEVLASGEEEARVRAAIALGDAGSALGAHDLCRGLQDESWEVQAFCAESLGRLGDGSAVVDLVRWQCETSDRKRQTRVAVASALARLGSSEGIPVLVNALYWDVFNAKAALEALKARTGSSFGLDPYSLRVEREKGADLWAGWLNQGGVSRLPAKPAANTDGKRLAWRIRGEIDLLGSDRYYYVQKAKETLAGIADAAYPFVVAALYSGSPGDRFHPSFHARISACDVIEMMAKPGRLGAGAAAHLEAVLGTDANGSVRAAAAQVLGRVGDRRSVGPLVRVLESDSDVSARIEAAMALGRLGFTDSLGPLGRAAADPASDPELAMEAAWWCEKIRGGTGIPALAAHLGKALSAGDMAVAERAHRRLVESTMRNPIVSRSVPSLSTEERRELAEGWKRTAAEWELVSALGAAVSRGDGAGASAAAAELSRMHRLGNVSREIPTAHHATSSGGIAAFFEGIRDVWIVIDRMKASADRGDYVGFSKDSRKLRDMFGFEADCHPGMDAAALKKTALRWSSWAAKTDPF